MIFALFALFAANLILRFNDFLPAVRGFPVVEVSLPVILLLWILLGRKDFTLATDLLMPAFYLLVVTGYALIVWPGGTPAVAKSFLPWLAVYFLAANLVKNPQRMNTFLGVLYACALVLVAHSVQQWLNYDGLNDVTGVGWTGETVFQGRVRYVGVMNDPNDLALFFAMMLPVALQFSGQGMPFNRRLLGYLLCLPLLFGIYLTNSRGGLLAAGAVAALYSWRRWGLSRAVALCVCMAMLALAFGPSRIQQSSESEVLSTEGRLDAWYEGLRLLSGNPLLGVGKDQFTEYNSITAHNSFVLCFAETGILGYLLWFGVGCYTCYALYEALKRIRPETLAYRQTALLFDALAAFYVGGFFLSRTYYIMFPVFIGLAVARFKMTRDELAELECASAPAEADPDVPESDFVPEALPLPDLSWRSLGLTLPRIVGLAAMSIVGIYLVVKFG